MNVKKIIASISAFSIMACSSWNVLNTNADITDSDKKEITEINNENSDNLKIENFTGDFKASASYDMEVFCDPETGETDVIKSLDMFRPDIEENKIVNLTIPSIINDIIINKLKSESCDCSNLNSLILPSKLRYIDDNALINTEELKSITIPEKVMRIGYLNLNADTVIKGYIGSCAEDYADKKGYTFEVIGDINMDGKFSASDMMCMQKYMHNIDDKSNTEDTADINLDSKIDIVDYILLKNNILEGKVSAVGVNKSAVASPDFRNLTRKYTDPEDKGYNEFVAQSANYVLLKTENEQGSINPVYSPISVYMALSQASEGADGNTLKEMLAALNAEDIDSLRTSNKVLFNTLYFDNWSSFFKMSNSIWINKNFNVNKDTLDILAKNYYTASYLEDFSDTATGGKISAWISKNTGGKFNPIIECNEGQILKIVNTVNFKNQWIEPFDNSVEDTFYTVSGDKIKCDFLKKTEDDDKVGFGENYMKYSLPMKNNYKMNFILSDEGVSVDDIVSDPDTMNKIINDDLDYQQKEIHFSVPEFDVASKFDLIETGKMLGINDAFDKGKADFSKMIKNSYIDAIVHEATISIDEEGCEAAAYTMITMEPSCIPPKKENKIIEFNLDRPFYYYVSDNNGVAIISGIIRNPNEK